MEKYLNNLNDFYDTSKIAESTILCYSFEKTQVLQNVLIAGIATYETFGFVTFLMSSFVEMLKPFLI